MQLGAPVCLSSDSHLTAHVTDIDQTRSIVFDWSEFDAECARCLLLLLPGTRSEWAPRYGARDSPEGYARQLRRAMLS